MGIHRSQLASFDSRNWARLLQLLHSVKSFPITTSIESINLIPLTNPINLISVSENYHIKKKNSNHSKHFTHTHKIQTQTQFAYSLEFQFKSDAQRRGIFALNELVTESTEKPIFLSFSHSKREGERKKRRRKKKRGSYNEIIETFEEGEIEKKRDKWAPVFASFRRHWADAAPSDDQLPNPPVRSNLSQRFNLIDATNNPIQFSSFLLHFSLSHFSSSFLHQHLRKHTKNSLWIGFCCNGFSWEIGGVPKNQWSNC